MAVTIGAALIWGTSYPVKPLRLPPGVELIKLRLRKDDLAKAYVRRGSQIEVWSVAPADYIPGQSKIKDAKEWELRALLGVNRRA